MVKLVGMMAVWGLLFLWQAAMLWRSRRRRELAVLAAAWLLAAGAYACLWLQPRIPSAAEGIRMLFGPAVQPILVWLKGEGR